MKTIQELIRIVQDRISLPLDDDDRWSTTAVVNAFNDALDDKLTPDLVSEGSNYLIQREVFTLSSYPLKAIPIPNRAVGRVVRELKYIASGTSITDEVHCLAINLDEKDKYSKDPAFYNSKVPYVFIENDSVRFIGGDGTGSIVVYYSLEPSTLQNTSGQFSTITNISGTTITVSTETATWTSYFSSTNGTIKYIDIFRKSTGAIIKANVKLTRSSATTYTVNGLSTDEINQIKINQAGNFTDSAFDYELLILPAGKSEFSTIPYEYDQLLALYVCERILESLGDTEGLQVSMSKIKETKESISRLSQNRLQSEKRKLEDRRTVANPEPRSIQSLILDVYDTVRVSFDQDPRWSTPAIIRAFNNVMLDKLAPDLVGEGSNYLVHRDIIPLTVNGSAVYPLNSIPLPRRAIGRALREVKYLPSGKTKLEDELNCPAISLEEKDMYSSESDVYASSVPYIYIENDNLRIIGGDLNGSLALYYSLEPSKLTATYGRYASITSWTSTSNIIDIASAGTDWTNYITSGSSKLVDIFCKSTGSILKSNVLATRSANSYTISGLTADEIVQIRTNQSGGFPTVGSLTNYPAELLLVPAGECEFATIPEEFDQLLVLYVAEKISESLGDVDGLTIIKTKINETRNSISRVTGNRLQGERRRLTDRRSIARIQRGQKWTRNYNKNYR